MSTSSMRTAKPTDSDAFVLLRQIRQTFVNNQDMAMAATHIRAIDAVLAQDERVFGEPSDEEFEPRDYNDADGVQTMGDCK